VSDLFYLSLVTEKHNGDGVLKDSAWRFLIFIKNSHSPAFPSIP